MKTGMIAAESIAKNLLQEDANDIDINYTQGIQNSWVYSELKKSRNFEPALNKFGTFFGAAYTFIDQNIFRGKLPSL